MNYSEFYKKAETAEKPAEESSEAPAEAPAEAKDTKPDLPKTWKEDFGNFYGYQNQIPMLALLAGAGALGGYALSNKKKRGAGALYGGMSLPALYLAYLASVRNGILPSGAKWDDFLDKGTKKVNDWGNQYIPESWRKA